jgi:hypothetical protein
MELAPLTEAPTRGLLNDNAYGKDVTALRHLIQLLEAEGAEGVSMRLPQLFGQRLGINSVGLVGIQT